MDLQRIEDALRRELGALTDSGDVPGFCAAVRVGGDTTVVAGGVADADSRRPARADTVFRIASLTKPVAALLTLRLAGAGVVDLRQDIATWVPEFADLRVLTAPEAPATDTVPLVGPITVEHLLTMTAGWGVNYGRTTVSAELARAGISPGPIAPECTADEFAKRLAGIPLGFPPGAGWSYHTSTDVLAVVLARAAGRPVPDLLAEQVSGPLGLDDLAYSCADPDRIATTYRAGNTTRTAARTDFGSVPRFVSLGTGLGATAEQYLGVLEELSRPRTIAASHAVAVRTPRLTDGQRAMAGPILHPGDSYGYLVSVATEDVPGRWHRGRFGWTGGTGCVAAADPEAGLSAVLLTNRAMGSPREQPSFAAFWRAVYG